MADWSPPVLGLLLLVPPTPLRPRRVQVFIDHLAASLARPALGRPTNGRC